MCWGLHYRALRAHGLIAFVCFCLNRYIYPRDCGHAHRTLLASSLCPLPLCEAIVEVLFWKSSEGSAVRAHPTHTLHSQLTPHGHTHAHTMPKAANGTVDTRGIRKGATSSGTARKFIKKQAASKQVKTLHPNSRKAARLQRGVLRQDKLTLVKRHVDKKKLKHGERLLWFQDALTPGKEVYAYAEICEMIQHYIARLGICLLPFPSHPLILDAERIRAGSCHSSDNVHVHAP